MRSSYPCGLGAEIALLLPILWILRSGRTQRRKEPALLTITLAVGASLMFFGTPSGATAPSVPTAQARTEWQSFVQQHGPEWKANWSKWGTVREIYRRHPEKGRASSARPETVARHFIAQSAALFGLRADLSELRLVRLSETTSGRHLRFEQSHQGVPVIGGGLIVHLDAANRLRLVQNSCIPFPSVVVTPTRTRDDVESIARLAFMADGASTSPTSSSATPFGLSDLGIYDSPSGPELVHSVVVRDASPLRIVEYLISDTTGRIVRQRPLVYHHRSP